MPAKNTVVVAKFEQISAPVYTLTAKTLSGSGNDNDSGEGGDNGEIKGGSLDTGDNSADNSVQTPQKHRLSVFERVMVFVISFIGAAAIGCGIFAVIKLIRHRKNQRSNFDV